MSLSAEAKINMSLDGIIKAKKDAAKNESQKKQKPVGKGNIKVKAGAAAAAKTGAGNKAGKGKRRRGSKGSNGTAMDVEQGQSVKVAKSVGAAKAKRAALVNQRRGLNATGKASKQAIEKAVKKEVNKKRQQQQQKAKAPTGLKISFKPSELNKTTDQKVAQQIKAVLSKQKKPSGGKGAPAVPVNAILSNSKRSVTIPGGGAQKSGGGGRGRGGGSRNN